MVNSTGQMPTSLDTTARSLEKERAIMFSRGKIIVRATSVTSIYITASKTFSPRPWITPEDFFCFFAIAVIFFLLLPYQMPSPVSRLEMALVLSSRIAETTDWNRPQAVVREYWVFSTPWR